MRQRQTIIALMPSHPLDIVPRVSWLDFLTNLVWLQGEHVTAIGPTGCGKTTAMLAILPHRKYVAVLATKPRDPLINDLRKQHFAVVRKWPPPDYIKRAVLWPQISRLGDKDTQRREIAKAMDLMYRQGSWCIYADEVRYLTQTLGLKSHCEQIWLQGRSLKLSFIAATQRPSWVPLEAYDQATHIFLWRETDRRNLMRLGDIGGVDTDTIRRVVPNLPKHDFLYINTRDGKMFVSNTKG